MYTLANFDLKTALEAADFASKLVISIGGAWAVYQFRWFRIAAFNIQPSLAIERFPYDQNAELLVIHAKAKNIGKTKVAPDENGFRVEVWKIPDSLNIDSKKGQRFIRVKDENKIFDENIVKIYEDECELGSEKGYWLEPGVEYDEVLSLLVPINIKLIVKETIYLKDKTFVDQSAVSLNVTQGEENILNSA